jgi:hypothetical protein
MGEIVGAVAAGILTVVVLFHAYRMVDRWLWRREVHRFMAAEFKRVRREQSR